MNIDVATGIIAESVNILLLLSYPTVGAALIVGLIISILQAVTQIQEQTLTFVPKMIVVFMMLVFTFPWMGARLVELCHYLWANIPNFVR